MTTSENFPAVGPEDDAVCILADAIREDAGLTPEKAMAWASEYARIHALVGQGRAAVNAYEVTDGLHYRLAGNEKFWIDSTLLFRGIPSIVRSPRLKSCGPIEAFTAALSVGTWRTKKARWLGYSMLIHSAYNAAAFIGAASLVLIAPADTLITIALVACFALWLRRRPSHITMVHRQLRKGQSNGVASALGGAPSSLTEKQMAGWMHEQSKIHGRKAVEAAVYRQIATGLAIQMEVNAAGSPQCEMPEDLAREDMISWIRQQSDAHGFNSVVSAMQLPAEYERSRWLRKSTYILEGSPSTYYEVGFPAVVVIAGLALLTALVIYGVFF